MMNNYTIKKVWRLWICGLFCFILICGSSFAQNKVYIDPTFTGSSNGTIDNPYSSLVFNWASNTSYYFKKGTTIHLIQGIEIIKDSVYFGAYGTGNRPMFVGNDPNAVISLHGVHNMIQGIEVQTEDSTSGIALQILGTGRLYIDNCVVHGGEAGINGTAGYLEISNCEVTGAYGDGMYLDNNDTLVIRNCKVHDMYSSSTNQNMVDCVHSQANKHVFVDSLYSDHHNFPGKYTLITNLYDSVAIKNSVFYGCPTNGALYPGGTSDGTTRYYMENCKIIGGLYGLQNNTARLVLKNCVFIGQTDNAIYEGDGDEFIYNCDFINQNVAIRCWNDTLRDIRNCIFYNFNSAFAGHIASAKKNCYFGTPTPKDSSTWGDFFLYENPLFVDPEDSDFNLQSGSACIGYGDITVPDSFDFYYNKRLLDGKMDLGPFNYEGVTVDSFAKLSDAELQVFPNPAAGPFTVLFRSALSQQQTITIYNLLGIKIMNYIVPSGQTSIEINAGLSSGEYILRLNNDKHYSGIAKIIIR